MAATAPQIDMAMIGRVLGTAQKAKARAAAEERQRLASLACTGPISATIPTHRIGQTGMLDMFGTMGFYVKVLDIRHRRDRFEALVIPESGLGESWVNIDDIFSWVEPVSPAKV